MHSCVCKCARGERSRKLLDGSFTRLHACTQVEAHDALSSKETKHKDLELAKYGEGNVNMGAGSGGTCVQKGDGDTFEILQPAT